MASEVVCYHIKAIVSEALSSSNRGLKLKQLGNTILEKCCDGEKEQSSFGHFCESVLSWLEDKVQSTARRYKAKSAKRAKLWSTFHELRVQDDGFLRTSWNKMLSGLGVSEENDWLLMQRLVRRLFDDSVSKYFAALTPAAESSEVQLVTLTGDELNALRYACGYIAHTLLKKFERQKRKDDKIAQFITCLGEMAVAGEGDNLLEYTEHWFTIVNRGGLFPLNENSFAMFIEIEKYVRYYLPKHVLSTTADKKSFKDNVHRKVVDNENVQFYWTLLSQEIDNLEHAQELLQEIVKLWVTVRGFSLTATWMECYKVKEKKTLQKSTGLRKSISGT